MNASEAGPPPIIRAETPADYERIAQLVEAAFGRRLEAKLVEDIRASEGYVPELALVAEADGEVAGQIMFSYVKLDGEQNLQVLLLSPLVVDPERQRSGVGKALVEAGIERATARGEPMIVVEGIPAYYPQFGFRRARDYGLEPPNDQVPDAAFMVLPLPSYDGRYRGRVIFPPAFDFDEA
ncbi:MAG: N-acetyltransferase [Dehalococcoidia bacterium]